LLDPRPLAASGRSSSASVGFGIIINYASYLQRMTVLSAHLRAASTNSSKSAWRADHHPGGVYLLGVAATSFTGSSFDLGFKALPNVL
jgi:SNF family Na+-dependent transporter